uniref:Uncharacterized protein n=1 Tax=Terrapene triunguis TaxID=2587831 RepID=A0A674JS20_9SAUR
MQAERNTSPSSPGTPILIPHSKPKTERAEIATRAMMRYTVRWGRPSCSRLDLLKFAELRSGSCSMFMITVVVIDMGGSPQSSTTRTIFCVGESCSRRVRVVLISPVYGETLKRLGSVACCSL